MRKINYAVVLTAGLLILTIFMTMYTDRNNKEYLNNTGQATGDELAERSEMRGLWVSYLSLDMQGTDRSFESFKAKFDKVVSTAKGYKCNTLIVQVRPFCDALYKSAYFPYSHILSGEQGKDAGYDALKYMCSKVHAEGMKIHAWINPYRVSSTGIPQTLSNNNPYLLDKSMGVELDSGVYLNPSQKSVRELIVSGVEEIVKNYDVDGIQFDDYFYPSDAGSFDDTEFNEYRESVNNITKAMYKDEWRQNNVNMMLNEVYRAIKGIDSSVVFGVSPQGNIDNNYRLGADVKSWCENIGYADYICPQMYYSTNNPSLSFEVSLQNWQEFDYHKNIKVYVGIAAYKAGSDADSGTWLNTNTELATQLMLLRRYGYDGYMIYDYSALTNETASAELKNLKSVI